MVTEAPSPAFGPQPSEKSYGKAVALSAVLGFLGAQHFYLGRPLEGLLDVGLGLGALVALFTGHVLLAGLFILLDAGHSLLVTILLLVGRYRDGQGRVVCYPGQRLPDPAGGLHNHDMRRPS